MNTKKNIEERSDLQSISVLDGLERVAFHDVPTPHTCRIVRAGGNRLVDLVPGFPLRLGRLPVRKVASPRHLSAEDLRQDGFPPDADTTARFRPDDDMKMSTSLVISVTAVFHADVHCAEPLGPCHVVREFPEVGEGVLVDSQASHAFEKCFSRLATPENLDDNRPVLAEICVVRLHECILLND